MFDLFAASSKVSSGEIGYSGVTDANASVTGLLNTVYLWAGVIAVLAIVIAGFYYVTANGNSNQVEQAKKMVLGAVIGLAVIIMAFGITNLIATNI